MRKFILLIAAVVLVSAAVGVYGARDPDLARRGAFLNQKVDSVSDLVKQVSSDPAVAERYAKHFGTTPSQIKSYFASNLKAVTLKKPMKVTVYFINPSGKTYTVKRLLPAGTRVFATKDGQPLLEWRCGNPVTRSLVTAAEPPKSTTPTPVVSVTPTVPETPVTQVAGVEQTATLAELPPPAASIPPAELIVEQAPVVEAVPTIVAPVDIAPSVPIAGLGLLLLPALAVASHDSNPPVIPEPGTLLAMGMFITAAFAARRAKKH
jgi:hypothetical protein